MRRILMDCDGVLADFVGACSEAVGYKLEPKVWSFIKLLPSEDQIALNEYMRKASSWNGMQLQAGAPQGIKALRAAGNEIVVVTAPWVSCPEWYAARRAWLKRKFDIDGNQLVVTSRKDVVEGDCLVDDRPENIESWLAAHPACKAFLYLHPYNATDPIRQDSRVTSFTWDSIPKELLYG